MPQEMKSSAFAVPGGSGGEIRFSTLQIATAKPYAKWLKQQLVALEDLAESPNKIAPDHKTVLERQQAFGYTAEDVRILMAPMAADGNEAVGSMGNDAALAVLSDRPRLLLRWFRRC